MPYQVRRMNTVAPADEAVDMIETVLSAAGWLHVDTFTNNNVLIYRTWRSPAAQNSIGIDIFIILARQNATALYMYLAEQFDVTVRKVNRYANEATSQVSDAVDAWTNSSTDTTAYAMPYAKNSSMLFNTPGRYVGVVAANIDRLIWTFDTAQLGAKHGYLGKFDTVLPAFYDPVPLVCAGPQNGSGSGLRTNVAPGSVTGTQVAFTRDPGTAGRVSPAAPVGPQSFWTGINDMLGPGFTVLEPHGRNTYPDRLALYGARGYSTAAAEQDPQLRGLYTGVLQSHTNHMGTHLQAGIPEFVRMSDTQNPANSQRYLHMGAGVLVDLGTI